MGGAAYVLQRKKAHPAIFYAPTDACLVSLMLKRKLATSHKYCTCRPELLVACHRDEISLPFRWLAKENNATLKQKRTIRLTRAVA